MKKKPASGFRARLESISYRRVLVVVGAAVLAAALGLLGEQGADYRRQERKLEQSLAVLRQALAALPPAGPDQSQERDRLAQELAQRFPAELDFAALEKEVRDRAKAQGVDVIAFEPLLAEQRDGYRVQTIRMQVLGRTDPVAALAKSLEARPGLFRVRWDRLAAGEEGFQHQFHWDWYLSVPVAVAEERCPEVRERAEVIPLQTNLFLWLWPRLRQRHQEAEKLQAQLQAAGQTARVRCRQGAEIESLRANLAVGEKLEQELLHSRPGAAE